MIAISEYKMCGAKSRVKQGDSGAQHGKTGAGDPVNKQNTMRRGRSDYPCRYQPGQTLAAKLPIPGKFYAAAPALCVSSGVRVDWAFADRRL
ncbi:hypothetical protein [Dentiradicibacter hellwigii]|uniref:Uncharacterized protein n=1 Tax=Dentiradicibacter hellwigii TaxID=3149053 RepID=A0ABV4UE48_9RHOO